MIPFPADCVRERIGKERNEAPFIERGVDGVQEPSLRQQEWYGLSRYKISRRDVNRLLLKCAEERIEVFLESGIAVAAGGLGPNSKRRGA